MFLLANSIFIFWVSLIKQDKQKPWMAAVFVGQDFFLFIFLESYYFFSKILIIHLF